MENLEAERKLIHYSNKNNKKYLDEEIEPGLVEIIESVGSLDNFGEVVDVDESESAKMRIGPKGPDDKLDVQLTQKTTDTLILLAKKIINLLNVSNSDLTHNALLDITRHIWPLYSRDVRTNMIGFDLQEYCDYFKELPIPDRQKLADQLFSEWEINK